MAKLRISIPNRVTKRVKEGLDPEFTNIEVRGNSVDINELRNLIIRKVKPIPMMCLVEEYRF